MMVEQLRLEEARERSVPWKRWGPYLSERQWGTVREDYSEGGDAWNYFTHDQARSRAYRWGEDGLAGISDDKQRLCFALALWNGKDPILKERLFGLTNSEGNHGEDVKEYYFYLDSTPTHSYMKYLYKYPQCGLPLCGSGRDQPATAASRSSSTSCSIRASSIRTATSTCSSSMPRNRRRTSSSRSPSTTAAPSRRSSTSCRRSGFGICGRGRRAATGRALRQADGAERYEVIAAVEPTLGEYYLYCEGDVPLLFTENETNTQRIFGVPNRTPYVKDGINNYVVQGQQDAVNPEKTGTKAAPHYRLTVGPGERAGGSPAAHRRRAGRPRPSAYGDGRPVRQPFRRGLAVSRAGGRRVLRGHHASRPRRRRGQCHAAGAGGNAVDASSSTTTTWTSGWRSAAPTPSSRRARPRRATTTGTTCTTAT